MLKLETTQKKLANFSELQLTKLSEALVAFVETARISMNRASFYNTQTEQTKAVQASHQTLMALDRGVYALALTLGGTTDYTKQIGLFNLMNFRAEYSDKSLLNEAQERVLVSNLLTELPTPRMLNLFAWLKENKINNKRVQKWILFAILNAPKLEFWAVKYRQKIRVALKHVWGERITSILQKILAKADWDNKEKGILSENILKYLEKTENRGKILEAISFVLGNEQDFQSPILKAFAEAKIDIEKGKKLPYEVLEGIRSTYHKDKFTSEQVLALTKSALTVNQKLSLQRKADKAKVAIEFEPEKYDAVRLYIFAYEMGLTSEIQTALELKALQAAKKMPFTFQKIGILMDASESMQGNETQKLRPMAVALAVRDMLVKLAENAVIINSNEHIAQEFELLRPEGATDLAKIYLELLKEEPDAIFIISDGYENAPAGRLAEVIYLAQEYGLAKPTFHVSPVMAAEAQGIKTLSDKIPTLPVNSADSFGLGMIKALFQADVKKGIEAMWNRVMPKLLNE